MKVSSFYNTTNMFEDNRNQTLNLSVDVENNLGEIGNSNKQNNLVLNDDFRKQSLTTMLSTSERKILGNKLYSIAELKALPMDVIPFDQLSFARKLLRLFTPFEVMYKRVWVTDAFIYPQMYMA